MSNPDRFLKSPARVLIVDDDERNLLALKTVIEDVADVVVASSGEAALRCLLKNDFAAILLDVFMPIMDGYETAQIIRQREQSKRIPIIFLSAVNKEAEHLIRGYEMGAVDYVFKPVEPIVLRSKVAVFVDLYEKTREIQHKALQEQQLRDENLRVQQERLITEQALRRAEERQDLVLASLPIVLYLEALDASPRRPHYVSGDLKALTGFDFDKVKRDPALWTDRLHPDDRDRVLAARAQVPRTDNLALEYRWHAADGKYRHFLEQAVVLRDADGHATEIAGTLLDVTSQRTLEDQLAHAQKMDAVGKLTGGIAHDFNNLLAAVLGGLGLIERRCELDERGKELIGMTRHAAEQGTDLVRRLLAFARRQQLKPAPVPMERLFDSLKGLTAHTLGGLVQVDWSLPDDIWAALADENQLELAMMNLIINARDAMPGGGTITVTARDLTAGLNAPVAAGDYVVLSVADAGSGIAPEMLTQIFEPFFTTKEIGKGTGLGLSMVYGFAQQSGGTVHATSEPGKLTVFELWIPRAAKEAVAVIVPAPNGREPEATIPARILLVDDHDAVRSTTSAVMSEMGHRPVTANCADSALDILNSDAPMFDLLVTDYAMPRISGTELIRRAREMHPDLPAIVITGYVDSDMVADRPDNVTVLMKPFAPAVLATAIRAAIG